MKENIKKIKLNKKTTLKKFEKELENIKKKKEKLLNLLLENAVDNEIYKSKLKELKESSLFYEIEIEKMRKDNDIDINKLIKFLNKIKDNFYKDEIKKSAIETFGHSVKISSTNIEITLKKISLKTDFIGGSDGN